MRQRWGVLPLVLSLSLISASVFAAGRLSSAPHKNPGHSAHSVHVAGKSANLPSLPAPPNEAQASLFYREVKEPIGSHNGVAFWLKGDAKPGSITIYLFATNGAAAAPIPVPGSGRDTEPLWPAWISNPVSTDFVGWHQILIGQNDFTYRAPVDAAGAAPPASIASADAFGISSAKTDGVIYVNDICWANIDSEGNAAGSSATIDDLSSGDVANWKIKGPPEAIARLVPGISTAQDDVKQDPISLKLDYSVQHINRQILTQMAARSLALTNNDYLISVPKSPFERIFPDSLPGVNEISSRVVISECPEQTSCGSFAIYSLHGLSDVSVDLASNLNGIGNSIPRPDVNLSVVKVWDRAGSSVLRDPDNTGPTPELLVKDDRVSLANSAGSPPDIRLTGDPVTDIPAGSEKQFWVDVTVPRNTPAGTYSGQLIVKSAEEAPFSLTLEIDVLPLRLLSPAKQYVINYRGKLGSDDAGALPGDLVNSAQLAAQMADLSLHGFHYISLTDSPDSLPQTLTAESSYNFQTPILYPVNAGPGGLTTAEAVDKLGGSPSPFCYLVASSHTLSDDLAALKRAGLQTAAIIDNQSDFDAVQDNLDVAIYPVDYPYVQDLLRTGGIRKYSKRDWFTWPAGQVDPQVNRLYAGYLLWRSDLWGAYVSDYETSYSVNPYDDTLAGSDTAYRALRPAMLTYPAQEGVIDTVQWEAIREGINDVRYLTTFYTALRECKDAKVDLIQVSKAESDVTSFLNQAFWLMSDDQYQKGRQMIANYAIELRKAVDHHNSHLAGVAP